MSRTILNTTKVVILQVYVTSEFMIELGPLIIECQIKKSQFCVASPHLLRLGEGVL